MKKGEDCYHVAPSSVQGRNTCVVISYTHTHTTYRSFLARAALASKFPRAASLEEDPGDDLFIIPWPSSLILFDAAVKSGNAHQHTPRPKSQTISREIMRQMM